MGRQKLHDTIELDGRTLEGGGQLIRVAFCLSALTGTPVQVDNIRGNRSGGGGLKAQHLASIQWLGTASQALISGLTKGSKTLHFTPDEVNNNDGSNLSPAFKKTTHPNGHQIYESHLAIGTAGSTALALQAILPYILFTPLPSPLPLHLHLSGGTNVSGSPSFEYIQHVLLPTLAGLGFPEITPKLGKRGWSHGGARSGGASIGHFTLEIPPRSEQVLSEFEYRPAKPWVFKPECPSSLRAIVIAPKSWREGFISAVKDSVRTYFGASFALDDDDDDAAATATAESKKKRNLIIQHEDSQHEKRVYFILIATIPYFEAPVPAPSSSPLNENSSSTNPNSNSYILAHDHLLHLKPSSSSPLQTTTISQITNSVTQALFNDWQSGAWVDEHLRDQLVIFQALGKGRSRVFPGWDVVSTSASTSTSPSTSTSIFPSTLTGEQKRVREASLHVRTAEWVCERILKGVRFDGEGGCEGCGFGEGSDSDEGEGVGRGLEGGMGGLEI